jgi:hypothetical protein
MFIPARYNLNALIEVETPQGKSQVGGVMRVFMACIFWPHHQHSKGMKMYKLIG